MSDAYFQAVAPEWDAMRERFFSKGLRERILAEAGAGLRPGAVAVDLGAGNGFLTEVLLERGASVVAVDRSEAMLDVLARRFPAAAVRRGDAEALPMPDGAADLVVANMLLHHVERPPAAIREMARVLRPGGRVVVADLDRHEHEFLRREHHDRWMGFDRAEVGSWLAEAGFADGRVADAEERCCATSCDGGDRAEIRIFVASGTLGPINRRQTKENALNT
ncbi:MAG: class I SAM-dependent methyltransferase [Methanobacteriota archaeon]